jgi:hypothetical protein
MTKRRALFFDRICSSKARPVREVYLLEDCRTPNLELRYLVLGNGNFQPLTYFYLLPDKATAQRLKLGLHRPYGRTEPGPAYVPERFKAPPEAVAAFLAGGSWEAALDWLLAAYPERLGWLAGLVPSLEVVGEGRCDQLADEVLYPLAVRRYAAGPTTRAAES